MAFKRMDELHKKTSYKEDMMGKKLGIPFLLIIGSFFLASAVFADNYIPKVNCKVRKAAHPSVAYGNMILDVSVEMENPSDTATPESLGLVIAAYVPPVREITDVSEYIVLLADVTQKIPSVSAHSSQVIGRRMFPIGGTKAEASKLQKNQEYVLKVKIGELGEVTKFIKITPDQ